MADQLDPQEVADALNAFARDGGTTPTQAPGGPQEGTQGPQRGNEGVPDGYAPFDPEKVRQLREEQGMDAPMFPGAMPTQPPGKQGYDYQQPPQSQQLPNFNQPQYQSQPEPGEHFVSEFERLAKVGRDSKQFEFGGNALAIHTLNQEEELEILQKVNRYNPAAQPRAHTLYTVALCLDSINGKPFMDRIPMGPSDDMLQYRFERILKLYPLVINKIMVEYNELRQDLVEKALYAKKESATEDYGTE